VAPVIELAILGLLKEQPMHGYDLRKRLRGDFGLLASLSFGSLYPALARLGAEGAVHELASDSPSTDAPARSAFLSPGSLACERAAFKACLASRRGASSKSNTGTRGRRVYELTSRGDALLHHLIATEVPESEGERGFALRLAFAGYLEPKERLSLLQRRRSQLLATREGSRRAGDRPVRPLDRYQRSVVDHAKEATEHDLSWIDALIATEEATEISSSFFEASHRSAHIAKNPSVIANASVAHAHPAFKKTALERSKL